MKGARLSIVLLLLATSAPPVLRAQHSHDHGGDAGDMTAAGAEAGMDGPMAINTRKHLEMTPMRAATAADSARARKVVQQLRGAIARYADTATAVADGFHMFAPRLKKQRVYHFTNRGNALKNSFSFDVERPTSLLYEKTSDGTLTLIGAMYTAPKTTSLEKLDERLPLSLAVWHKHVNLCLPRLRERERWLETKDGHPVFGPASPIATEDECRAVGGRLSKSPLGWMVHVNAFAGDDLATIFKHQH